MVPKGFPWFKGSESAPRFTDGNRRWTEVNSGYYAPHCDVFQSEVPR